MAAGALAVVAVASGCAPGDTGGPLVHRIDDAIFAVESYYRAPQQYFEISATESVVSVIVAVDGGPEAEQAFWTLDDGLVEPVPVASFDRPTFRSGDLDFRPGRVLGQVRDELPNSEILDFAITASTDGVPVYDARLQSRQGGVLMVLLDGDGRVLAARSE